MTFPHPLHVPTLVRCSSISAIPPVISCPLSPQVCSSIPFLLRLPWSFKTWWGSCWSEHYISILCCEVWVGVIVALSVLFLYCSLFQDLNPCLLCICQCLGSCSWYIVICHHVAIQTPYMCMCVLLLHTKNTPTKFLGREDIYNFKALSEGSTDYPLIFFII